MPSPASSTSSCAGATAAPRSAAASASRPTATRTQRQASATLGLGDLGTDGYNVFASLSHLGPGACEGSGALALPKRRLPRLRPGRPAQPQPYLRAISTRPTTGPSCNLFRGHGATIGEPGSANPGPCLAQPTRDLVAHSSRDALFVAGTASSPRGFELFGDVMFARNICPGPEPEFHSGPPFRPAGTSPPAFILPSDRHPQNPYPFEVALRTRFSDHPRVLRRRPTRKRVVVGVRHPDSVGLGRRERAALVPLATCERRRACGSATLSSPARCSTPTAVPSRAFASANPQPTIPR